MIDVNGKKVSKSNQRIEVMKRLYTELQLCNANFN